MNTLSRRLRAARIATGFSDPGDFAGAAHITSKRYQRIEEGLAEPLVDELLTIAKLTGLTIDFLITGRRVA